MADPIEEWKDIPRYLGLFQVSNKGQIKSLERVVLRSNGRPQFIKARERVLQSHPSGYYTVRLCKQGICRTEKVHVLVAETFIGPRPKGLFVCHFNGDKIDNRVGNLRYATRQENVNDGKRLGEILSGSKHFKAKLNEEKVATILERLRKGERQKDLAEEYGVRPPIISNIKRFKIWKNVERLNYDRTN